MTVQTLFRLADLESLPNDTRHRELVEGELIELPPPEWSHVCVAHNIYELVSRIVRDSRLGRAFVEAGFRVSQDDRTWIQPDVSMVRADRLPSDPKPKFFSGAPDLAVEVISPSETAEDVQRKIDLLLRCGSQEVWAVYPKTRTVEVRKADGSAAILHASDTMHSAVLGGAGLAVQEFFED